MGQGPLNMPNARFPSPNIPVRVQRPPGVQGLRPPLMSQMDILRANFFSSSQMQPVSILDIKFYKQNNICRLKD